jgi:hypothetical protein
MSKLGDWLKKCPGTLEVKTGNLEILGEKFEAAYYRQQCEAPAGCQKPGTYIREAIYALGYIPAKMTKNKRKTPIPYAFKKAEDAREWYLSTYMIHDARGMAFIAETDFHPCGVSFQIAPWTIEGEAIDKYERKPYPRADINFIPD